MQQGLLSLCESQALSEPAVGKLIHTLTVFMAISVALFFISLSLSFPTETLALHARLFFKGVEGCTVYSPMTEL